MAKTSPGPRKKFRYMTELLIFLLASLLYSNTIFHDYVYDDVVLISRNSMTHAGVKALPDIFQSGYLSSYEVKTNFVYRPLSKLVFAIEWQLFPGNPHFAHLVNVLLFAVTCVLFFIVLRNYTANHSLSLLASLLFLAHPIHTEAVANIKSLDEILCLSFFLLSALFFYRHIQSGQTRWLVVTLLFFVCSVLCKESAYSYCLVYPLLVFYFSKEKIRKFSLSFISVLVAAVLCLVFRQMVLGTFSVSPPPLENYIAQSGDLPTRLGSAIYLIWLYIFRLFIPQKLMYDASLPQLPLVSLFELRAIVILLLFTGIAYVAFRNLRERKVLGFGILFFFITILPVSNIFVLIGAGYAERLLFAPSIGFCLCAAAIMDTYLKGDLNLRQLNAKMIAALLILLLYIPKTWSRNKVWKDNYTLYSSDVLVADKNARAHYFLGNYLLDENFLSAARDSLQRSQFVVKGISEVRKAIELYPDYAEAHYKLGQMLSGAGQYQQALSEAHRSVRLDPGNAKYVNDLGKIYFEAGKTDSAKIFVQKALEVDPDHVPALINMGIFCVNEVAIQKADTINGRRADLQQNLDNALSYLNKAKALDPTAIITYKVLEKLFEFRGDSAAMREVHAQGLALEENQAASR